MKFLEFLELEMTPPGNYGWFHIIFLVLILCATAALIIFARDVTDKKFRRIVLITWIVLLAFEIYKQIIFTFKVKDGVVEASYQWYSFPFQFCSSPLYVLPFIAFLKDGKVRNALMAFASTFMLFGGLAVMFYPNDVFCEYIGINIQTMVHHGFQLAIGVYIAVYNRKKLSIKFIWPAVIVFACFAVTAIAINEIGHAALPDHTFNMFFISRHHACTLPVLGMFYGDPANPLLPYPAFLIMYLVGFCLVALIIYTVEWALIVKTTNKNAKFYQA